MSYYEYRDCCVRWGSGGGGQVEAHRLLGTA